MMTGYRVTWLGPEGLMTTEYPTAVRLTVYGTGTGPWLWLTDAEGQAVAVLSPHHVVAVEALAG